MNKYIIIDVNGYVVGRAESTNLIESDTHIEVNDFSEADDKKWDHVNKTWKPDDRPLPAEIRQLSKINFIELFTDTEMEALIEFAKTSTKAALFLRKLDSYDIINLNNVKLQAAITAMETVGVLSIGRANEIINSTSDVITEIQPPRT